MADDLGAAGLTYVDITGNLSGLMKSLGQAEAAARGTGGKLSSILSGATGGLGSAIVGGAALGAGFGLATKAAEVLFGTINKIKDSVIDAGFASLRLAGDYEQSKVAFGTILGGAEKAEQALKDLTKFAAETPFELPELTGASKKLLAFGVEQKDLISTLRSVGDVASGVGAPIGEIAEIYGKAKVQGRLFAEDINQLTGRGIPVIQELAKQFGVTENQVKSLVESGAVSFDNLEEAFVSLTSKGGKFAGMMEAQSQTLVGRWSTFQDTLGQLGRDMGARLLPAAKKVTDVLIALVESPHVDKLIDQIGGLVDSIADNLEPALADATYTAELFWLKTEQGFLEAKLAYQEMAAGLKMMGALQASLFGGKQDLAGLASAGLGVGDTEKRLADVKKALDELDKQKKAEAKGEDKPDRKSKNFGGAAGGKKAEGFIGSPGDALRKAQEAALKADPKLKLQQDQLAEQKKTNDLLAKRTDWEKGQAERKAKAKERNEELVKNFGRSPLSSIPKQQERRKAAAEAKKKRQENNPLLKKRAERKAQFDAKRKDYLDRQKKRQGESTSRNQEVAKKPKPTPKPSSSMEWLRRQQDWKEFDLREPKSSSKEFLRRQREWSEFDISDKETPQYGGAYSAFQKRQKEKPPTPSAFDIWKQERNRRLSEAELPSSSSLSMSGSSGKDESNELASLLEKLIDKQDQQTSELKEIKRKLSVGLA